MITCILSIARTTFTELVRQKVFYFLVIFALVTIGGSIFAEKISSTSNLMGAQFQMLKDTSLGSMSIFTALLAILATANFLPKDLEDRTIYTTLSKPVPRFAYLMGKLGGILLMLALAVLLMTALFLGILALQQSWQIAEIKTSGLKGDELDHQLRLIHEAAFNINLLPGILLIFIKAALLASLTLFISTFATSALFTILISVAIFFIGHMQSTAVNYWFHGVERGWFVNILIGVIAILFPDLQAFNLTDDIVAGVAVPMAIFLKTFGLGCLYIVIYYFLSALVFSGREL
jgi:hypothetical protein